MGEEQAFETVSGHKEANAPGKIEIDIIKMLHQLGIEEERWPLEIIQKRVMPDPS
ncbi:hypothetical protein [Paenibacillus terrigena]|uniref:hypothetical protein n=1 Tax=Paenibacillus terrigena TaxID=369333 RepID=UPI0028D0A431|nr:hypothetical protein [Paenibacillus terrigena]